MCLRSGFARPVGDTLPETIFREVIHDAFVGTILLVDLHDAGVFLFAGGEDARGFTGEKNPGVGAPSVQ